MSRSFQDLADEARKAHFEGWDFSFVEGRRIQENAPWDYSARVKSLIAEVTTVVDHGTGGGEVFASFAPLPAISFATEAYGPNVEIAAKRLRPMGAHVIQVSDGTHNIHGPGGDNQYPDRRLPLADEEFDLFLARNAAFSPSEVFRILKEGGRLISQNGLPCRPGQLDLSDHLGGHGPDWGDWDFLQPVQQAGFEVEDYLESTHQTRYLDIGAVIFVLEHIPWAVVDYSFDDYRHRLEQLHEQIEKDGPLITEGRSCFIKSRKPDRV